jgi:hypothetical protein
VIEPLTFDELDEPFVPVLLLSLLPHAAMPSASAAAAMPASHLVDLTDEPSSYASLPD